MTKSNTNNGNRKPELIAYHVQSRGEGDNAKSFWTRIGAAWAHNDFEGFNIELDCVPVDGRIVLRKQVAKAEAGAEIPTTQVDEL